MRACFRQPVSRTPVWFMRQAGRSLPEYRAARGTGSILTAIADAPLAAELTLQPVRRYGVDAAILFSDIVVPVHAIGFGVDVEPGKGPVVASRFAARPTSPACARSSPRSIRRTSSTLSASSHRSSPGAAWPSSALPAPPSPWPAT